MKRIESLMVNPSESISITLLGPRRCGKTSLLKMLPKMLPDTICVFFDLQDNPVDSPAAFFQALAQRAQENARRDGRLEIPPLADGPPFEAANRWLQALESMPGDQRILICIDEFEKLEELFPGDRGELLRLMGLFRATIQHKRKVRLLVSGVAPFDELEAMWDDHFINAREVRIDHLDREASLGLLTHPVSDFPADAISMPVADSIFNRTGGQPYLLQLYAHLLITYLNQQKRRQAHLDDLETVDEEVLTQGAPYFRHTVQAAPKQAQEVLLAMAHDGRPIIDSRTRRWLWRRSLLTEDNQLRIPILGKWLREEVGV